MKWIGQHIWDFISRFRSDVYMEAIESGTIASGGNLGLDSNNKVVKQADTGITDLHGAGVDGSANQIVTDDGDGTITSEASLTYSSETLVIGNDHDSEVTIKRLAHTDNHGGPLVVRGGDSTAGQLNKNGGHVKFYGGQPTGSGTYGNFKFFAGDQEGSGTTLRTAAQIAQLESNAATSTDLTMFSQAGADQTDYFKLSVAEHGATTLSTVDNSAAAADLTLDPDGKVVITPADFAGDVFHLDADADTDNVVNIDAGSLDVDSASDVAITSVARSAIQTTGVTGHITLESAHTAGQAIHIDGDADVGSIVDIDAGILDIDVLDDITIDAADNIALTTAGTDADGKISLVSGVASDNTAIHLDGDANAASIVDIDAGVLDIDVTGNITIDSAGGNVAITTADSHYYTTIDRRKFTVTSSTDDDHNGDVIYAGSGTTTLGNLVYMRTDGAWANADADNASMATVILGIALGTDPTTDGILIRGMYTLDHDVGNNQGIPLYVSTTAGEITATAPSGSGDIVRIVGYNLGDDDQIWFDPSKSWVEIA